MELKYAIQVLFDGGWLYVMDSTGEKVLVWSEHHEAVEAMRAWERHSADEPAARVVSYK